jgi:hypothetical protein
MLRWFTTSHCLLSFTQEIGDMLSNHLTLDEEEAVQAELHALQAAIIVSSPPLVP